MYDIKPIETYYKGRLFRSQLEANWAAYFDSVHIEWIYESEGYTLSNGMRYLPDFYLQKLDIFVECRGPLHRSLKKTAIFIEDTNKALLIALPDGRFFLADSSNFETGDIDNRFINALYDGDSASFDKFQKNVSCMVVLDDDAIGELRTYFANYGDSSDAYCGDAPDWCTTIKDRSTADGGDARATYWGGYSTWIDRNFFPSRWTPKAAVN